MVGKASTRAAARGVGGLREMDSRLAVVAQADDFDAAFEGAYAALTKVSYEGITYRRDIGHQVRRPPSCLPA